MKNLYERKIRRYDAAIPRFVHATLALCALGIGSTACDSSGPKSSEVTAVAVAALQNTPYYYRLGKRVEANVAFDRFGVVALRPGSREAIAQLASRFGLKLGEIYQDSFYVVVIGKALERTELELLIDKVKRDKEGAQLLREAGLLMLEGKGQAPVLLPSQFIARFDEKMSRADVENYNAKFGVRIDSPDLFAKNQYLLSFKPGSGLGVLELSALYEEDSVVTFAHPNFWRLHTTFEQTPFDPLYANQWHHRNTGASGGVVDADADTSWAWDFGFGSSKVVIAVVDQGVEQLHPDLSANIYSNAGEVPGNGLDDDGNGLIDDVHGWDFGGCGSSALPCGDNDSNPALAADNHGTAVAGVAAARAFNATGVAGSCPNCQIMPLRVEFPTLSDQTLVNIFGYVASMHVDIVNNSWGHTSTSSAVSTAVATAIADAASAGSMIIFAAGNGNSDGWCDASYPSLDDSVMAVSSSTNLDKKVKESAFGSCVDILAPSHRGYVEPYNGTLNITTTDRVGKVGYNSDSPPPLTCAISEPSNVDYTNCFGGTSSAAPLIAGIAGLIKSANSTLSRSQIQRLLQDTADKIVDSVANYNDNTGRSIPLSHSYGRVNAYEAVRVAALAGSGAKASTDIFFRDNELDWGNTTGYLGEQSSAVNFESPRGSIRHWASRDIKVDAPPYATAPTALTYDAFVDEKPSLKPGDVNKVYVRIRNRGQADAKDVALKLLWTQFGTALPAFPSDFWTKFPADSTATSNPWTSAKCTATSTPYCTISSISYSGASLAGSALDVARIAVFDMPAPTYDPSKANHFCLLAVADAANDRIDPISRGIFEADSVTPNDNNVTHRNYSDLDISAQSSFDVPFYVRNPLLKPSRTRLILTGDPRLLKSVIITTKGFTLNETFPMKERSEQLVWVNVKTTSTLLGDIDVTQQNYVGEKYQTVGGLTLRVTARKPVN